MQHLALGARSRRRQLKTATGHNGDSKTATHNLEPSQNGDNNESKTATDYTCLQSVIANRIIDLYSVYYSVVKVNTKTSVATVLTRRVRDEL